MVLEFTDAVVERSAPTTPAVFPYGRVDETSPWPRTPGASDCPDCGAVAINVQGVLDCPDCAWSTARGDRHE